MNGMERIIISNLFPTPALPCPPFPAMPVQMRKGGRRRPSLSFPHSLFLFLTPLSDSLGAGREQVSLPSLLYPPPPFLSASSVPSSSLIAAYHLFPVGEGGTTAPSRLASTESEMGSDDISLPPHCSYPRLELQISLPYYLLRVFDDLYVKERNCSFCSFYSKFPYHVLVREFTIVGKDKLKGLEYFLCACF